MTLVVDNQQQDSYVGVYFRQGDENHHVWHTPQTSSASREMREYSQGWNQARDTIERYILPLMAEVVNECRSKSPTPSSSSFLSFGGGGGGGGGDDRATYERSAEWLNTNNVPKWNERLHTLGYRVQVYVTKQTGSANTCSSTRPTIMSDVTTTGTKPQKRRKRRSSISEVWNHLTEKSQFGLFLSIALVPDCASHLPSSSSSFSSSSSSSPMGPPKKKVPNTKTQSSSTYAPPPCPVDNPVLPTTPIPNPILLESMDIRFTPLFKPSPHDSPKNDTVGLPSCAFSPRKTPSMEQRVRSVSPRRTARPTATDTSNVPHTPCRKVITPTPVRSRSQSRARPPAVDKKESDAPTALKNQSPSRRSRSRSRSCHGRSDASGMAKRTETKPSESIAKAKKKTKSSTDDDTVITADAHNMPQRKPCGHVFLREMSEMSSITLHGTSLQSETRQQHDGKSRPAKLVGVEPQLSPCVEDSPQCPTILTNSFVNTSPQACNNDDLSGKIKATAFPQNNFDKSPVPSTMEAHAAQRKRSQMWHQLLAMPTKVPLIFEEAPMHEHPVAGEDTEQSSSLQKKQKTGTKTKMEKVHRKKQIKQSVADKVEFSPRGNKQKVSSTKVQTGNSASKHKRKNNSQSMEEFLNSLEITESDHDPDVLTVMLPLEDGNAHMLLPIPDSSGHGVNI
eukprot:scaffold3287_cov181-Amphora_coffeaeformis.AAC.14